MARTLQQLSRQRQLRRTSERTATSGNGSANDPPAGLPCVDIKRDPQARRQPVRAKISSSSELFEKVLANNAVRLAKSLSILHSLRLRRQRPQQPVRGISCICFERKLLINRLITAGNRPGINSR